MAVTGLADAIGMEQSAVSHQLRLLRSLGLVVGNRSGRSVVYSLYDNHVAQLLDEAVSTCAWASPTRYCFASGVSRWRCGTQLAPPPAPPRKALLPHFPTVSRCAGRT
ncbi:hypothetical protein GCM10011581_11760 [Saccharopolyspora subtropica]|uniref:HTH arsR-type domain-containing protein n=1 Tax=Saccharopolyspora thermophila TaxID=89367 RepID=A0A917JMB2_9PSEU|nr:hypothetical protein GCM10011581_11760 [Saccharopolyspora subtropica]